MARYDYKCPGCKDVVEKIHSIHDKPEIRCESCDEVMFRLVGNPPVFWKGGHWATQKTPALDKHRMEQRKKILANRDPDFGKTPPNVQGEVCRSWTEAADLAHEKGLDRQSYLNKAKKEGEKT